VIFGERVKGGDFWEVQPCQYHVDAERDFPDMKLIQSLDDSPEGPCPSNRIIGLRCPSIQAYLEIDHSLSL
jgi:hypothetical protein